MAKKDKDGKGRKVLIPLVAVALGFVLGSIVVAITGKNPLLMFNAIIQGITGINIGRGGFNPRHIGELVIQAMPIILTGLCVGFAFRTGLFNIGAEGQLMMGSLAATAVALTVKAPGFVHVPLILLSGMGAGAAWGAIPGYLKARFNVHEVVVTIMLNYTALHLNNWTILNVFGSVDRVKTAEFPASALLKDPWLASFTNGSRLNWGFVPVILAVLAFWFILEKTPFGFSLRAVGFNKDAAKYAGMKVNRNIVLSMVIAGAFAGLAGAIITTGTFSFGRALPAAEGYGFDGIAVALVGMNHAPGILLAGLLFGVLKSAGPLMQSAGIPREIGGIIQASIVMFVAMKLGIERILDLVKGKRAGKAALAAAEDGAEAGV
ncbi:MAG: ABC transporter permease [Spirochaetes bacterium]|nr:ABC transporter permease [Spirochaetota bacterium]MBU1079838.1 ABC transporter permease [Spirochaetota bacterium]